MHRFILLVPFLAVTLLSSCEKEIELKTKSSKCIVVNALITENEPIEVSVYSGVDFVGRNSSQWLENATLAVYSNGELLEEISGMNTDSSYRTSVVPVVGETYTIKVDCQRYPSATATATVPNKLQVKVLQADSVRMFVESNGHKTYESSGEVEMSITDTTSELRYYLLTITGYYYFMKNPDDIKSKWLTPEYNNATAQPTSMSDILTHLFESADVKEIEEKDYILLSNQNWRGKSTTLRFGLSHNSTIPSDITVMSFDEEYYKYFISKELQQSSEEDDIMFGEPVNIYSNVKNGLGLFAGYNLATAKLYSVCDTIYKD